MTSVQQGLLLSWSPEKAWWWGVLLGDGNVYEGTKDWRVSACGSLSTTRRWVQLVAPENLGPRNPQEFKRSLGTYQCYVNSKALVDWFKAQGICGSKSDTLVWPEDLPAEFKVHFLRGLWDTDGSLSIWDRRAHGKKGNSERKAGFGCKAVEFVQRVRFELECVLPGLPHVADYWSAGTQKFSYGGTTAQRVADYLYAEAPEHLRNEDRVEVYQQMKALGEDIENACCPCGAAVEKEGWCTACWWANRLHKTGEGTVCACGKSVLAKGLCSACYSREVRVRSGWKRKSVGLCVCGKSAYRRGKCDACYSRERREAQRTETRT
jgi:hypothetical protein